MDLNVFKEYLDWFENLVTLITKYEIDEVWFTDKVTALSTALSGFQTELTETIGWLYETLAGYDARITTLISDSWSITEEQAQSAVDNIKDLVAKLGIL